MKATCTILWATLTMTQAAFFEAYPRCREDLPTNLRALRENYFGAFPQDDFGAFWGGDSPQKDRRDRTEWWDASPRTTGNTVQRSADQELAEAELQVTYWQKVLEEVKAEEIEIAAKKDNAEKEVRLALASVRRLSKPIATIKRKPKAPKEIKQLPPIPAKKRVVIEDIKEPKKEDPGFGVLQNGKQQDQARFSVSATEADQRLEEERIAQEHGRELVERARLAKEAELTKILEFQREHESLNHFAASEIEKRARLAQAEQQKLEDKEMRKRQEEAEKAAALEADLEMRAQLVQAEQIRKRTMEMKLRQEAASRAEALVKEAKARASPHMGDFMSPDFFGGVESEKVQNSFVENFAVEFANRKEIHLDSKTGKASHLEEAVSPDFVGDTEIESSRRETREDAAESESLVNGTGSREDVSVALEKRLQRIAKDTEIRAAVRAMKLREAEETNADTILGEAVKKSVLEAEAAARSERARKAEEMSSMKSQTTLSEVEIKKLALEAEAAARAEQVRKVKERTVAFLQEKAAEEEASRRTLEAEATARATQAREAKEEAYAANQEQATGVEAKKVQLEAEASDRAERARETHMRNIEFLQEKAAEDDQRKLALEQEAATRSEQAREVHEMTIAYLQEQASMLEAKKRTLEREAEKRGRLHT